MSASSSNESDYEAGVHFDSEDEMTPKQCSALRRNDIVLLKGKPCKIVEMSTSKPGKHGHSKIHFIGLDIFTGKKYEDISPSSKNLMVPTIVKKEFILNKLVDDDEFAIVFDPLAKLVKFEKLKVPEGRLGEEIKQKYNAGQPLKITVIEAMGGKGISACRPDK